MYATIEIEKDKTDITDVLDFIWDFVISILKYNAPFFFFLEVDFMQKIIHLKDLISCMLDTFLFEYEV